MTTSTIRILVVDDYEQWRQFVLTTLRQEPGLQVVGEASDGPRGVELAEQLQPDLVLLDIGLPGLNGIEAARKIRQQSPTPKILFCSENVSSDIAEGALATGANGYLVKSDAARDLLPAVLAVLEDRGFVSPRFAAHDFAGTSETRSAAERGHVVNFYADDTVLLDGLSASFCNSLGAGESVVAIVTSSHRTGLENRLIARGVDVRKLADTGRLLILDADRSLSEFMDTSEPNRELFLLQFAKTVGRAQDAAVAKSRRVAVFGEMVAVLWAQKKYDAAIKLEELWNELALTCSFYLCCAYPAGAFEKGVTRDAYATICAQHSDVICEF